jgi:signal transduction histidine kinase
MFLEGKPGNRYSSPFVVCGRPAMRQATRPAWLRYSVAVGVTAGTLALKLLLVPLVTRDEPVLLFFAAVMVSAAFGGLGPGLLATALGMIFDGYFFMRPFNRLALNSGDQVIRLAIFFSEGVFVSLICARMKSAHRHAEESAAEAQELEGQLLHISETEQRRIGHDLHDGLSQHLTGMGLLARRMEEVLADAASPAAADASRLSDLAKSAVELTRDLCRSLAPSTLLSSGLAGALRGLCAHAESLFHIRCTFDQIGDRDCEDPNLTNHLYRISQEAVSNAARHGHARHVQVRLDISAERLILQIRDDGSGIEDLAVQQSNGLGLKIMRYRARIIGASIEIVPGEAGGTVVTCSHSFSSSDSGNRSALIMSETPWTPHQTTSSPSARESSWSKTTPSSAKG